MPPVRSGHPCSRRTGASPPPGSTSRGSCFHLGRVHVRVQTLVRPALPGNGHLLTHKRAALVAAFVPEHRAAYACLPVPAHELAPSPRQQRVLFGREQHDLFAGADEQPARAAVFVAPGRVVALEQGKRGGIAVSGREPPSGCSGCKGSKGWRKKRSGMGGGCSRGSCAAQVVEAVQ